MGPSSPHEAPRKRRQWRRAFRALRLLVRDPSRTEQVFEVLSALSGPADEAIRTRFRSDPAGVRLLREKPDLVTVLTDRAALEALPEGSLGRAYAATMARYGVGAEELAAAEEARPGAGLDGDWEDLDHQWVGDRVRDAHDLWHVVTGYGMDEAGEAMLLAFTHAQVGSLGLLLIAGTAAVLGPKDVRCSWQRHLLRAWLRGRRARWLPLAPWEEWMARPVVCVRRDLRIEEPERAHRGGVPVAPAGIFGAAA